MISVAAIICIFTPMSEPVDDIISQMDPSSNDEEASVLRKAYFHESRSGPSNLLHFFRAATTGDVDLMRRSDSSGVIQHVCVVTE